MDETTFKQLQAKRIKLGNEQAVLDSKITRQRVALRELMASAKKQFGTDDPGKLRTVLANKDRAEAKRLAEAWAILDKLDKDND